MKKCNLKILQAFKNMENVGSVKTIVEGGATVQVTSQDDDESDEEDAGFYHVKVPIPYFTIFNELFS